MSDEYQLSPIKSCLSRVWCCGQIRTIYKEKKYALGIENFSDKLWNNINRSKDDVHWLKRYVGSNYEKETMHDVKNMVITKKKKSLCLSNINQILPPKLDYDKIFLALYFTSIIGDNKNAICADEIETTLLNFRENSRHFNDIIVVLNNVDLFKSRIKTGYKLSDLYPIFKDIPYLENLAHVDHIPKVESTEMVDIYTNIEEAIEIICNTFLAFVDKKRKNNIKFIGKLSSSMWSWSKIKEVILIYKLVPGNKDNLYVF